MKEMAKMKNLKNFIIFFVFIIFVPIAFSEDNTCKYYLSPNLILNEIKIKGAGKVINDLWSDEEKEKNSIIYFVARKIETGDPKWLEVARVLRPASDAGSGEDLLIMVARALPNAPALVLKMIGDSFPLRDICTLPFIEGEVEIEKDYLNRTEKALISVQKPELQKVRWECLRIIHYFKEKIYLDEEREKARQHLIKMEKRTD